MGVPSVRATTTADFVTALERALATPGPHLIEAVVPSTISGLKLKLLPRVLGSLAGLPGTAGSRDQAQAGAIDDPAETGRVRTSDRGAIQPAP